MNHGMKILLPLPSFLQKSRKIPGMLDWLLQPKIFSGFANHELKHALPLHPLSEILKAFRNAHSLSSPKK